MPAKEQAALELRPDAGIDRPMPSPAIMDIAELFRYAVEKNVSSETMKDLMEIRRELNAEQNAAKFDAALTAFQAECPIIEKRKAVMNKDGRSVRYHYAPLDSIISQVRGLLDKHGFSFTLDTVVEPGWVKAICKIKHSAREQLSEFKVPVDSTAFMNNQQQFASALTFAKRYAFCNAFGILTGDEDTDAAGPKEKPKGPSTVAPENISVRQLVSDLWALLVNVRGLDKNWKESNQFCWDEGVIADTEALPDLPPTRLKEVIETARKKLTALGKLPK